MAEASSSKGAQPPLVDRILQCGKLAFDPALPEETREPSQTEFRQIIDGTSVLQLMPVLNLLVQPGRTQDWLRAPLISALARLPLRPRGVHHTIEFILSVHPTTSGANASVSTGRGASISHDALNAASRLLSSPPAGMSPDEWFQGIAPQLFSLLQGEGEPEMDKAAAFVIGFGILGRKLYGAPGMPGWKAFVEPILHSIDPSLPSAGEASSTALEELVVNLSAHKILTSAQDLARSIQRLSALLNAHPNPALTKRVLKPILFPLWSLSYWPGNEHIENIYRQAAKNLLKTLIQLSSTPKEPSKETGQRPTTNILTDILQNLLFKGRSDPRKVCWSYATVEDGGIQVQEVPREDSQFGTNSEQDFSRIDGAVDSFIALLESMPELKAEISGLFLYLFSKWLSHSDLRKAPEVIISEEPEDDRDDLQTRLIEATMVQKMMIAFPEKLVDNSSQLLNLVCEILFDFTGSEDGNEETAAVALSLLNIVLASSSFRISPEFEPLVASIQTSLESISRKTHLEVSKTAQNLLLLLKFHGSLEEPEAAPSTSITDQQLEDRKSYSLAMSYLTATDSPPPVRAQGLELISGLIKANSSILDIPALLVLFSSLLQDSEEYIYLRVVKSFIQLSQKHPKAVMKDLIDRYVDPNEEVELDPRLRLGEALLQVIQSNPLAFTGETAQSVCQGLLFIAGRRGYRPNTELEQERKNKLKRKQDAEAEEAWDGPVPQLDEVLEVETQEKNEILSQIVSGWESKRGAEDIRTRASALSILGSAIESNISAIGPNIISTIIDMSIHILTLEAGPEKGILRRSAILLIMNFVKALDTAREEGKKLGFGFVGQSLEDVQRILKYVEASDSDGMVRQYSKDVIEGLEAWQMNALIPAQREEMGIQELAGLSIRPRADGEEGRVKPRIEEIE